MQSETLIITVATKQCMYASMQVINFVCDNRSIKSFANLCQLDGIKFQRLTMYLAYHVHDSIT